MKKILFISNITNKITNYTKSSILISQSLGYDFHLASNLSNFSDDVSKYNITVHHIDINRFPFHINNIKAYLQMLSLMKKEKFDLIHCNTPIGGVLGRLCGYKAKIPVIIYTAHGFHFYKGASLLNKTLYKWAEKWMSKFTDVIITINREDYLSAQKFKLRNNGKVYYVPGVGIDTEIINKAVSIREDINRQIGTNNESCLIISVGELNKNKNNKIIIKVLGKINNPNIHYLICGTGNKQKQLLILSKKYHIQNNIHFMGYRTDVPNLLKSCDIFALPSYREGLSRSLMEAMGCGLPCIVSNIRGNIDLIMENKGGYLCNCDNKEDYRRAIYNLYIDNQLRKNMGYYNMEYVKIFDSKNVERIVKNIYSKTAD